MLTVALIQLFLQEWIQQHAPIPAELSTLLGMLGVLGTFGGLLVMARRVVGRGIRASHGAIRSAMGPVPKLFVHTLVLILLYCGYHWFWERRLPDPRALGIPL